MNSAAEPRNNYVHNLYICGSVRPRNMDVHWPENRIAGFESWYWRPGKSGKSMHYLRVRLSSWFLTSSLSSLRQMRQCNKSSDCYIVTLSGLWHCTRQGGPETVQPLDMHWVIRQLKYIESHYTNPYIQFLSTIYTSHISLLGVAEKPL